MASGPEVDYRATLANERTFLAWLRTALALIAGGAVAGKALNFEHDAWRWAIAAPPIVAGAVVALRSRTRSRAYEAAMRERRELPVGPDAAVIALVLVAYAVIVLLALAFDG